MGVDLSPIIIKRPTLDLASLEIGRDTDRDGELLAETDLLRGIQNPWSRDEHERWIKMFDTELAWEVTCQVGIDIRVTSSDEDVSLWG